MTTTTSTATERPTYLVGRDREGFYRVRPAGGYMHGRRFVHRAHAEAAAAELNADR